MKQMNQAHNQLTPQSSECVEAIRFEEALRLVAKVFDSTLEGIMITDAAGTVLAVNSLFTAVTGYRAEEAIGRKSNLLNSGLHDAAFYAEMWTSITEFGCWQGKILNKRKDGVIYPEWLKITAIQNEAGDVTHYAGVFTDLTDRQQWEETIRHKTRHDPLTGLPNRQLFQEHLEAVLQRAQQQAESFVLLFLDLDRFKGINESYGFVLGDLLLKSVVERLESCLTPQDVIARIGGDEFAILITELPDETAISHRLSLVADAMKLPFYNEHHEFFITASIGISLYPTHAQEADRLMKYAETALYKAIANGGNQQQIYVSGLNRQVVRRQIIENSLHKALERNEFQVVYQPKVKAYGQAISGMEALLRWEHPELGSISPAEFIPLAEDLGVIESIGEWVLHTACLQTKAWQDLGLPSVRVAVNLSMRQFQQPDLVATVARILEETQLEAEFLELEITESMAMTQGDQAIFMLKELKKLGVQVALDDFGTGYSSLSYLTRFPIDSLKIDRSFIFDLFEKGENAALVHAIISLAHSLKLHVVAEGVETERQLHFLRQDRCDEIQGYLFSRPLPPERFEELLRLEKIQWTEVV